VSYTTFRSIADVFGFSLGLQPSNKYNDFPAEERRVATQAPSISLAAFVRERLDSQLATISTFI